MIKQLLPLLISFSLLLFSCSKDDKAGPTPNSTIAQQSVYSVVEISNSPGVADTYIFHTSGDPSNQFQVLTGSFSYTSDIYDINYIIGSVFHYHISFVMTTPGPVIGCADIKITTYHNNNLIDTQIFQVGYTQLTQPAIFCDPLVANNSFNVLVDIVAN